ncbi:hypothetical protein JJD41_05505 [Oxynema sp. CENA135]|uniref:hypothetical protein n=1 Tax=Oxynema sp. CENA135 TaxID=984206 RepID=UPI0019091ECC|nr:hypothetical protein [Oxynema sp. CENA135]MBK4729344.1 hypothetical protein [Oxynema sp. CENA135]
MARFRDPSRGFPIPDSAIADGSSSFFRLPKWTAPRTRRSPSHPICRSGSRDDRDEVRVFADN